MLVALLCIVLACASPRKRRNPGAEAWFADERLESTSHAGGERRAGPQVHVNLYPGERLATEDEAEGLANLIQTAEKLRGLRFVRPVPITFQSSAAFERFALRRVEFQELDKAVQRYRAYGIFDESITAAKLKKHVVDMKNVSGYYDEKRDVLAVREESAVMGLRSMGDESRLFRGIIVHELVHALQDQHFGLDRALASAKNNDARNALFALAEGDATMIELGYVVSSLGGVEFQSLVKNPETLEKVLFGHFGKSHRSLGTPALESSYSFRYLTGTLFVGALVRSGGGAAVNEAFRHPPRTTSEVLEPKRYLAHWRPKGVKLPSLAPLAAAGYRVVERGSFGGRELNLFLAPIVVDADRVAADWDGDDLAVVVKQGVYGVAWAVRFSDRDAAARASAVARDFDPVATGLRATRRGHSVLLTRNVDSATHEALAAGF